MNAMLSPSLSPFLLSTTTLPFSHHIANTTHHCTILVELTLNMTSHDTASSSSGTSAEAVEAKLRTGLSHKERGNALFTSGDIPGALAAYHHSVLYLSGLESRSILGLVGERSGAEGAPEDLSSDSDSDSPSNSKERVGVQAEKELSRVYSNMAACYLKQCKYGRAIAVAEKALKCDSHNDKASFRKASALRLSGDVYKAKAYLEVTISQLQQRSAKGKAKGKGKEVVSEFERELKTVEGLIASREAQGRERWKGFLSKKSDVLSGLPADAGEAKAEKKEAE